MAARHRHEANMWIFAAMGTAHRNEVLWCYQCGAVRWKTEKHGKWQKPTGIGGDNPAMKEAKRRG